MDNPRRLVSLVRRRISLLRFWERLQASGLLAAGVVLGCAVIARILDSEIPVALAVGSAVAAALIVAGLRCLLSPISVEQAASEADRILGTRERISSALAVMDHRAKDPLGFLPVLTDDAARSVHGATRGQLARALPLRLRRRSALTLALLGALFLVPFVPVAAPAEAGEDPSSAREREQVAQELDKFDRRLARTEQLASKKQQEKLREMIRKIRAEAKRLAGEKPRRAAAVARLSKLERKTEEDIRRFAGMKTTDPKNAESAGTKVLRELGKALEKLEKAAGKLDPGRFSALHDKLRRAELPSQAELAETERAMREFTRAMENLTSMAKETGSRELMKMLEGLASSEALRKLARAMAELQKAMKENMSQEELEQMMRQLSEAMRNYRNRQLTDEQIEQMIKAMEELRRMIEAGEAIGQCKSGVGGMFRMGMGGMLGQNSGNGDGLGTGGAGTGRGGTPPKSPDARTASTELVPGQVTGEGDITLIRNVRSLPSADEHPQEYRRLVRASWREAEEALRRGEIPRRYREYVKRFFRDEDE